MKCSSKKNTLSVGPHCGYFRMQKLKPRVAKVSTVASVRSENYQLIIFAFNFTARLVAMATSAGINKVFIFKSHSFSIKRNLLEWSTKIKELGSLNNYQNAERQVRMFSQRIQWTPLLLVVSMFACENTHSVALG